MSPSYAPMSPNMSPPYSSTVPAYVPSTTESYADASASPPHHKRQRIESGSDLPLPSYITRPNAESNRTPEPNVPKIPVDFSHPVMTNSAPQQDGSTFYSKSISHPHATTRVSNHSQTTPTTTTWANIFDQPAPMVAFHLDQISKALDVQHTPNEAPLSTEDVDTSGVYDPITGELDISQFMKAVQRM